MQLTKSLLLPLLTALALPTAVNAETMPITKTQLFDSISFGGLDGSLRAICFAEKRGFLSNNEKLEMINIVTSMHKKIHKDKTTYYEYKEEVLLGTRDLFPNCLP